jgi:hypothetical protein
MARREEAPPENLGQPAEEVEPEAFGELIRYTVAGYLAGLMVGFVLDQLGFQRGAIGQWLVRTLSGEGESILEGIYAIRARLARWAPWPRPTAGASCSAWSFHGW